MSNQIPFENVDTATLHALHQAALLIADQMDLDTVLKLIVDEARAVTGARYTALGVAGPSDNLHSFIHSGMDEKIVEQMDHLPRGRGLLGAIIKEKQPIRVDEISKDPRSSGFPAGHPPMSNFLGVPLVTDDQVVGNLYLTDKMNGEPFNEVDQQVAEIFGAHAAVAIKNARLYEKTQMIAIRSERDRIGMDLHDGVIQSIYAVSLTLDAVRNSLGEQHATLPQIDMALTGLHSAISDIRTYIMDLRPRNFPGVLETGIRQLVREFQANVVVPIDLSIQTGNHVIPHKAGLAVFMTTQEALANIARHAKATRVEIRIVVEAKNLVLTIADDGLGFDVASRKQTGHGLSNMKTRAEGAGGRLIVKSAPNEGTTIQFELPIA